jgi:CTP:molybdopterin cytidylyltransferase MocA
MTLTGNAWLDATTRPAGESVSVVIPMGDRAHDVGHVLQQLPDRVDEVVVVREAEAGKRAALRAGFAAARGDYIVMIDADAGIDQAEIERFIGALQSGSAAWSRTG